MRSDAGCALHTVAWLPPRRACCVDSACVRAVREVGLSSDPFSASSGLDEKTTRKFDATKRGFACVDIVLICINLVVMSSHWRVYKTFYESESDR